jgi:hypothetical protein
MLFHALQLKRTVVTIFWKYRYLPSTEPATLQTLAAPLSTRSLTKVGVDYLASIKGTPTFLPAISTLVRLLGI